MPLDRTWYNTLVDDDGSNTVGTLWNKAAVDSLMDAVDAALLPAESAWTPYAATWGAMSGSAPAIGNGILGGRYLQLGKTIQFLIYLITGSTSTYGSGNVYSFSLPMAAAAVPGTGYGGHAYTVSLTSPAGAGQPAVATHQITTSSIYLVAATGGLVGATVPFTWAANAALFIRGTYERT